MSRRRLAVAALVLTSLIGLVPMAAPARARPPEATMTFTGALDVAGLLGSLTVRPRAVTIPAGGEVAFVNGTTVALRVTVGLETATLEPGGSRTMLFTGADRPETFTAAATGLGLPSVGSLTSSSGQVSVLAIPAAPMMSAAAAPTKTPGPASAGARPEGAGSDDGSADDGGAAGPRLDPSGAVIPLGPGDSGPDGSGPDGSGPGGPGWDGAGSGPGSPGPGGSSPWPGGTPRSSSSGGSDEHGSGPGSDGSRPDPPVGAGRPSVAPPVLPPFPGFRSAHDQLGLIALLGLIVLAGLGTMAFRAVLAFRPPVEVGAHSQAARKARVLRRQRG
ncbi:hypothetical protein [Cryptosporangium sp. NPDC051539]|uniref:hypothetical protein n=1 Tax=Cryptosporangium sp. NPDC051539 TaxID=3363962 RepID=UPI003797938D